MTVERRVEAVQERDSAEPRAGGCGDVGTRRHAWCAAVPIRFETTWRECGHDQLLEGVHYASATRATLGQVFSDLRDSPSRAREIAAQARNFVEEKLGVASMHERLERTWLARIRS
jgi:hypothetical protein